VAAVLVAVVASCAPPNAAPPEPPLPTSPDPALASWSILPPGNGNGWGFTSRFVDSERSMYDRLDDPVADGTLTDADLGRYFKDARLDAHVDAVRTDRPRPGVRIDWDHFGVPHVDGRTAADVGFGAGWSVAESRLLIAELGRVLGRAGTIEMAGSSDLQAAIGKIGSVPEIAYTDAELLGPLDEAVAGAGPDGPRLLASLDGFVEGLNAWLDTHAFPPQLTALGLRWRHWTRADVMAVGVVVDDIFGSGGGDEVGNAAALQALVARLGPGVGNAVYRDLKDDEDPMASVHVDGAFPFPLFADAPGATPTAAPSAANVVDPAAVALPDAPVPAVHTAAEPPEASNFLALEGSRTASGHPILVGGPQSSYSAPELLFEMALHGGGYDARGITFPGLGPWVVIGRSRSYAWTATAGGSDLTDERVERLCEPDGAAPTATSTHYVFDGACIAMTRPPGGAMVAWRTVHGPVVARATVGGAPVAISRQRASRFVTAHAATAFWRLNQGAVTSAADFAPTMSDIPMSFNWVYVNATDVAYFHSGWYPVRARGVRPDLPSWGTGQWEWRGRVDWHAQPQEIDPASGFLVSWNNKVAHGWTNPDNDWGTGEVQRVDLIRTRAARLEHATPAEALAAVQDAGTADLRGEMVLPAVLDVLDGAPAPTAALGRLRDDLAAWSATGAHRRDRNHDDVYDADVVGVMDLFFGHLVHDVFAPGLGRYVEDGELRRPKSIDYPTPGQFGAAFARGWYSLVVRDLRRVLGDEPTPAGVPRFCGGGDLARCREVVWHALGTAAYFAPRPKVAAAERIRFVPYAFDLGSMRWVNRSTFQQVVSFGG
jgi:acyl-homoserine lactone acylase PvdQ